MMRCGSWGNIYTKWIDVMPNFSRLLITVTKFGKSANFIFSHMTWFWEDFIGLAGHEVFLDLCDLEKDPLAHPVTRAQGNQWNPFKVAEWPRVSPCGMPLTLSLHCCRNRVTWSTQTLEPSIWIQIVFVSTITVRVSKPTNHTFRDFPFWVFI